MKHMYLHSCFSDGDGLLFHSFMNSNLIPHIHLIEFINTTYTLYPNESSIKNCLLGIKFQVNLKFATETFAYSKQL